MKFGTVINCMDGRIQIPAIDWIRKEYSVDYVDTITEAGPVKILANNSDTASIDSLKNKAALSIQRGSKIIAIVAHHDCLGNPVEKEKQLTQLKSAIKIVKAWGFRTEVIGLWIDENWKVNKK